MKKVISMIGTSIFENYFEKEREETIRNFYEDLKEKRLKEYENERERVDRLRNSIRRWIKKEMEKENISAEIKSLIKIKEEIKEDFENYFLCSDTILSKLAGDLIKELLEVPPFNSKVTVKVIEDLQVWNRKEFNKGMSNLIIEIYSIANNFWNDIIINITGGYKATIPYLTILAQLNNCPLYYIFENTDALMKIPNLPFSASCFDWNKIEEHEEWFQKLEEGITDRKDYQDLIRSKFYKDYDFLVWTHDIDSLAELNPIGKIIFQKYKEKIFEFYAPNEVQLIIQSDKALENLLKDQFSDKKQRENKTEIKNGHFVYDAGNNQLRIFYRELENKIYIYKVFNKHDEYEKYLKFTPYSDTLLNINEFKRCKIKREV